VTAAATIYTPLLVERAALLGAPANLRVVRTGMGPRRAARARVATGPALVAGVGGGLAPGLVAGDLVVASEVRHGDTVTPIPSAPLLAGALRRLGLRTHVGPVLSSPQVLKGAAGADAVDMESAWLAPAGDTPFAVVRAVVDTPGRPLWRPGTPARGVRALRALRRAVPAFAQWAAATGAREVTPADPDLVLVVGPDSRRLAEREGVPAYPVDDAGQVDLRWLAGARRVAIVAGATPPPPLVDELVHCLSGLGPVTRAVSTEVT